MALITFGVTAGDVHPKVGAASQNVVLLVLLSRWSGPWGTIAGRALIAIVRDIFAPLEHQSGEVLEAPMIGPPLADGVGHGSEIGDGPDIVPYPVLPLAMEIGGGRPCPAGVFPFGLRWQAKTLIGQGLVEGRKELLF